MIQMTIPSKSYKRTFASNKASMRPEVHCRSADGCLASDAWTHHNGKNVPYGKTQPVGTRIGPENQAAINNSKIYKIHDFKA